MLIHKSSCRSLAFFSLSYFSTIILLQREFFFSARQKGKNEYPCRSECVALQASIEVFELKVQMFVVIFYDVIPLVLMSFKKSLIFFTLDSPDITVACLPLCAASSSLIALKIVFERPNASKFRFKLNFVTKKHVNTYGI